MDLLILKEYVTQQKPSASGSKGSLIDFPTFLFLLSFVDLSQGKDGSAMHFI